MTTPGVLGIELDEDGRCKHDMLPDECFTCRHPAVRPNVPQWSIAATFESRCPACGGTINEGDQITKTATDDHYRHRRCPR